MSGFGGLMVFVLLLYALLTTEEPSVGAPATAETATVETATVETATSEQVRFFETSVRPVLTEHCLKCHGDKKQWAGLRLDSREAALRGGDSGAAVVPGKPLESLLIRAVRHEDKDLKMPQDDKLSQRQIADPGARAAEAQGVGQ